MTKKTRTCCSRPTETGWHKDDEVVTTFGSLKLDQEQTLLDQLGYFLNVYWKKGDSGISALQEYYEKMTAHELEVFCEWER